jgi:hypothetical protein
MPTFLLCDTDRTENENVRGGTQQGDLISLLIKMKGTQTDSKVIS